MENMTAVILAAGKGTRMKSDFPKVLHKVCGIPMVEQVIRTVKNAGCDDCVVITGFGGDLVRKCLGSGVAFAEQKEQLGTGHAVMQTESVLKDTDGYVLVICGDTPLLQAETIQELMSLCVKEKAAATVLTANMPDPSGYGRIIRDDQGHMSRIVEQKDGNPEELAVKEINTGTYCFDGAKLFNALRKINNQNAQGEYYLTDVFGIMIREGEKVLPVTTADTEETMGVNSRRQLAEADRILRLRKLDELMDCGVSVIDPANTYVEQDVTVGHDTVLFPGTVLEGNTTVGIHCEIGPYTHFRDVICGDRDQIHGVYAHSCRIGSGNDIGPFVHLRPGTEIRDRVHIGNFVEVKNSVIDDGTKLPHLIYCGDADLGKNVNMGCGSVTVNYDGKEKHRTIIGDHASIGCNTNLVAPVTIGKEAFTAAGSTITKDVGERSLAVARARQKNIENWVTDETYKK